jgi:hypothetical protein
MKTITTLAAVFAVVFSCASGQLTLEEISPHFSTNTPIVWQAPTNHLPKSFWIYKIVPRIFSATTISNGIVLAGFQAKGFPKPSTNHTVIWDNQYEAEPKPPYFSILPDVGQMSFSLGNRIPDGRLEISKVEATERAWKCLVQLGIDHAQLKKINTAGSGLGGVFLPRQIEGVEVYAQNQGFQFRLGKEGKLLGFCLLWPNLERETSCQTASPQQIIACIRAFKTVSPPDGDEPDYFGRIKNLAKTRKLTITKITTYYGDGVYGETPTNNEAVKVVMPLAELDTVADFGSSNATVKLLSPIISSEVVRLLK